MSDQVGPDVDRSRPARPTLSHRFLRNDQLILLILAILVGVAVAYGAIGFREFYLYLQFLGFGTSSEELFGHVAGLPAWQRVAVPAAGGLAIGLFVHFVMPARRPHGVADVMEAAVLRSGSMDPKAGIGAALVSAASIGVGASVGREGPAVHLGASLASVAAKQLRLTRSQSVTVLGCGVAAAVSASFNAPIAGVFFALEVVIGHYALSAFAPIVIASVAGAVVSRSYFGDFPAFILPSHSTVSALEIPAFALLGLVSAVLALIFLRSVAFTQNVVERVPVPRWSRPMFGGCLVGLIALVFPHVLGVGYGSTDAALKELFPLSLLIALIAAKTAATAISLGSGFGGGVFSPSLFLGAMVGGAFGILATGAFPHLSSGHGAYTLVGMGAVAGCVLGAPISTILIVFELTSDYGLTIAVMVAVVIASVITSQLHGQSFFQSQLDRRGVRLKSGREAELLNSTTVGDLMSSEYAAVTVSAGMKAVRENLQSAPHAELFVVQSDQTLHGTITLSDLSGTAFDTSMDNILNAGDVARLHPPVLAVGDSIERALNLMQDVGEEHIGVVENYDSLILVGFVHEVDVMLA